MPDIMTFEDAQAKLKRLKDGIQAAEREHARAEGELDAARAEKERVEKLCADAGVQPEGLDAEVKRLLAEIDTGMDRAFAALEGVDSVTSEEGTDEAEPEDKEDNEEKEIDGLLGDDES